jgi:NAD(P)-dependent dehydrogenase (short-subunit alcohol dehydrogenase family)
MNPLLRFNLDCTTACYYLPGPGNMNHFRSKAVLITGGTMGIGLATGLAFAREGAHCILTYRWGSTEESEVLRHFEAENLIPPMLVQADVANSDDTAALMEQIERRHDRIEVFVSNVAFAQVVKGLDNYNMRALSRSLEYTAWPMVEYTRKIRDVFGMHPRYIVGLSSGGVDQMYRNYDFVAASKAVLETLCRYLNYRLFDEDVRINIIRAYYVETDSLRATFGMDFPEFVRKMSPVRGFTTAEEVANAVVILCSGLMDGVSGQVLEVDRGSRFSVNLMGMFDERKEKNLGA